MKKVRVGQTSTTAGGVPYKPAIASDRELIFGDCIGWRKRRLQLVKQGFCADDRVSRPWGIGQGERQLGGKGW